MQKAAFKVFDSYDETWQSLFAKAAAFASTLGPERVISVGHHSQGSCGIVVVWYWEEDESAAHTRER